MLYKTSIVIKRKLVPLTGPVEGLSKGRDVRAGRAKLVARGRKDAFATGNRAKDSICHRKMEFEVQNLWQTGEKMLLPREIGQKTAFATEKRN